ncbi:glycosyltransferase [Kordia algicida OT-1]|uniref:Glycosyltransferase 2-like domain-containing protein n=1 Tax=Kordia algicida OT-1 TaxID=391587 RepID=A9DR09_9FLAO|nr:glycosyltransferase [Kordia algicida]EDP96724.1 hypothetical protein KAOT1_16213 [Kordia algicida OT-1]
MKIGVLIIFRNDETVIDVQQFTKLFTEKTKLQVCLVNNGSTDKTLEVLKEIQEEVTIPISIIDVKKSSGYNTAIKAGVRYLTSKNDLPYILCLQHYTAKDMQLLDEVFEVIQQESGVVKGLFKNTKRMMLKNVFSIRGIMEKAS